MKLEPSNPDHVEMLAKDLHEGGREAVEQDLTMHVHATGDSQPFVPWGKLPAIVQEGRRVQARALMVAYRLLRD